MLIKAFALARQRTPLRLLILGEGEQRAELEDLVRQMGLQEDISLPGFQQNPYGFMRRAAMLALSSRHEAFGRGAGRGYGLRVPGDCNGLPWRRSGAG